MTNATTAGGAATRVCVLGNSHVGALKLAYDADPSLASRMRLTFFAARGDEMRHLRLRDGRIEASTPLLEHSIRHTSGGLSEVDPQAYDAFLVYGLELRIQPPADGFFSRAVREQTARDAAAKTAGLFAVELLGEAGAAPVFVGLGPSPAAGESTALGRDPGYAAIFEALNAAVFAPLGVELLGQPEETFADGWRTDRRFSIGSRRLDVGDEASNELHPDNDSAHMNEAFGRIWLQAFETRLRGLRAVTSAAK